MSVPAEAERLLAGAPLSAHLATSVDDRPHVAPVWYVYDDGVLSVLTGGRKLRNLRRNPRVAVSIERAEGGSVDWSVKLLGTARVVADDDRYDAVAARMNEKYHGATDGGGTGAGDGGELGEPDGGGTGESSEGALVEIAVGSATWSTY